MKRITKVLLLSYVFIVPLLIIYPTSFLKAQPRNAGQMVVPRGWEQEDSVFLATVDHTAPFKEDIEKVKRYFDTLGVDMTFSYGRIDGGTPSFGSRRKGYIAYGADSCDGFDFSTLGNLIKQRVFYPSPSTIPIFWDGGYRWRFIDDAKYSWHNNKFDSNDVSPYAEFDKDDSLASSKYFSKMYNSGGDSLEVGTDGRLILGYNDMRRADKMLKTTDRYPFRPWGTVYKVTRAVPWEWGYCNSTITYYVDPEGRTPTQIADSIHAISGTDNDNDTVASVTSNGPMSNPRFPKAFTARLEFNIDTTDIITTGVSLPEDSIPLLRLQVLYKKGVNGSSNGWNVLPFVPFKTISDTTKAGWYALVDTMITPAIYHTLYESWRVPDTIASGAPARNWKFKQLNIVLKDQPFKDLPWYVLKDITQSSNNMKDEYGSGSDLGRITDITDPDLLVKKDSSHGAYIGYSDDPPPPSDLPLFEIRLSSTYRAKLRIRSLVWQDTTVDKFLYRRRFADSSHSLNSTGSYGGFDDSLKLHVERFAGKVSKSGTILRNILFNDTPSEFAPNSASGIAYLDYMLSRSNLHSHIREQEYDGGWSQAFRRERLSYDGIPPSVYENQTGSTYSQRYKSGGFNNPSIMDVFPGDYLPFDSLASGSAWPFSPRDTMQGMLIGRVGDTTDPTFAYRAYTENALLMGTMRALRNSAYVALNHPRNKRFALVSSPMTWGIIFTSAIKHSNYDWTFPLDTLRDHDGNVVRTFEFARSAYNQRVTTPEETYMYYFGALANGVSALNVTQYFTTGGPGASPVSAFGIIKRGAGPGEDSALLHHSYNFGHRRTEFGSAASWLSPDHNVVDSMLPPYYLGFSNQYRANVRVASRIHPIYDTLSGNKYPLKRFEWLNAYSANAGIPGSSDTLDRQTYVGSFIKAFCTTPVKRWERTTVNGYRQYIDSTDGLGNLVPDSAHRTYVEVGMFRDNPGDTLKGYAAMVVNGRLWPSLRDAEDSIYYNNGLTAQDQSRSLFGDIATRKAWFKLDTIAFPPSFRSSYYVVRDVWHQDTTYLVHCDSAFGVYMKPGEARLLYIEKSVSIRSAPKAATGVNEFAFNNGRRVAEILKGRQSVVTYTRNGNLYVNYPGAGERFEGYNERSAGENIATGYEMCIDSSGACHRPSICAGMNDTSIAITYYDSTASNQGVVKVAFQAKPYDPWWFATATDPVKDTTADFSGVTPVIAPVAEFPVYFPIDSMVLGVLKTPKFKDSIWVVAATYLDPGTSASGIIAFRFKVTSSGIQYLNDVTNQFFYNDGVVPSTERSAFPTITSRALSSSRGHYPVRLAWQKNGQILYNQYRHLGNTITPFGTREVISKGLPSYCYNLHPSIALNCTADDLGNLKKGGSGGIGGQQPQVTFGARPDTNIFLRDYVVWECKLAGKNWNTGTHFWPVLRIRLERMEARTQNGILPRWQQFQVFKPKIDTSGFHWPVVSAGSKIDTSTRFNRNLKAYYDAVRIGWYDEGVDSMEFAHFPFRRTILNEGGINPSLPQPTYYIKRMTDSSMVQPSVAFLGLQKDTGINHVRITNGWFPMIAISKKSFVFPSTQIHIKPDSLNQCPKPVSIIDIGPPTLIKTGGGTPQINWKPTDPSIHTGIFPHDWPVVPDNPVEFSSDTFRITALDSIIIPRKLDSLDITSLRNALYDNSDYFIQKILLKRHLDSSYVGTVDSIFISKLAARYPGSGVHPTFAKYEHPFGMPTDSVFLSIEILRGNTANNLERGFIEYIQDDDIATAAFKQASGEPVANTQHERIPITMEIYPNPLSLNATVEIVTPHSAQTLIELYDINGKNILTLFNGSSSGKLTLTLDGKDLTNGIYFLRTQCGNSVVTKKVELIK